jgi:hypothetical protein
MIKILIILKEIKIFGFMWKIKIKLILFIIYQ